MIGESAESASPVFSDARPVGHALGGEAGKAHERYATKALVRRHGGPPDGMVFAARRETDHAPVRFPRAPDARLVGFRDFRDREERVVLRRGSPVARDVTGK